MNRKFQSPRNNDQTITNNQITICKRSVLNLVIGDWNLFGICILVIGSWGRCLALGCFLLTFLPAARAQDMGGKFREANASYRTGDFEKAADLYQALARENPEAAVFFYDLGNAYVKLDRMSDAVLAYEKALRLAPRDRDTRQNLNFARSQLEYRVEDNRNWYLKATSIVLSYLTQREINAVALIALMLFLLSGIVHFMVRGAVFWSGFRKFLLGMAILAGAVVLVKHIETGMMRDAIVMTKECEVRYGPSRKDQMAFRVGEGIKVVIIDRREDWSRILLTNGESGWIQNSDIAEIGS